jgi:hypothetical protein
MGGEGIGRLLRRGLGQPGDKLKVRVMLCLDPSFPPEDHQVVIPACDNSIPAARATPGRQTIAAG